MRLDETHRFLVTEVPELAAVVGLSVRLTPKYGENMQIDSLKHVVMALAFLLAAFRLASAETGEAEKKLVGEIVAAAGGEAKLLSIFRFRERVLITATPAPAVTPDEKENRTSVVQVSGDWWIGKDKRDKDKVRVLCWAWSLRILLDAKSGIHAVPEIAVDGKPAVGLRVSGSVKEPMDLFFDKESKRLVAIDYTDTRHIFSDWKMTKEGNNYPAHVAGFRFADRAAGKLAEKQWYQTDILELTPLAKLPDELK